MIASPPAGSNKGMEFYSAINLVRFEDGHAFDVELIDYH